LISPATAKRPPKVRPPIKMEQAIIVLSILSPCGFNDPLVQVFEYFHGIVTSNEEFPIYLIPDIPKLLAIFSMSSPGAKSRASVMEFITSSKFSILFSGRIYPWDLSNSGR
jgi:hypothetical protein